MTISRKCSCIICRKLTNNLGISAHILIVHEGKDDWIKKGNKARRGKPSWNSGLTKSDERIAKGAEKISRSLRLKPVILTKESRLKMSEAAKINMKQRYASGWEPICGRCKKYDYESPIAGKIKVDGTWELIVAKHLDSLNVKWIRNKTRFNYLNLENKSSTYQPDFYVEDWDTFIEVKGYETDLDRCKWSQFPKRLVVWKREQIKNLERGQAGNAAVWKTVEP